jgi:hypothetical protein
MDQQFIHEVATELNKHINVPFLNEEQEHALIELVLGIAFSLLPKAMERAAKKLP